MATSLVNQLAHIAVNSINPLDLKAQKKAHSQSLVFDPQAAATQDFDTVYQICLEGYQELCQIDRRFSGFASNIFSEQSKKENRAQMTAAENTELDVVIESFLSLVGVRLLLKPAIKAVEWLVRRFRVHENNTEALVLTFLPYHTKPIFTNLLSILPPTLPAIFKFLHPYKGSLACPSRHTIVHTATNNLAFLSALNTYVLKSCRTQSQYRGLLSFWVGVFTEAVSGMLDQSASRQEAQLRKEQDILLRVLPVLNEGLSMKNIPDLRVGCYIVLTILTSKAQLEDYVLEAMMEAVVSHWTTDTTHAGLICLSVIAQNKRTNKIPSKVYRAVMALSRIDDDLKTLGEQYQVEDLTYGLICGILENLDKGQDASYLQLIWSFIKGNLVGETRTSQAIETILLKADSTESINNHGPDMQRQLANLILKFSESDVFGETVRNLVGKTKIDLELLEMKLQARILPQLPSNDGNFEDTEMKDAVTIVEEEDFTTAAGRIPTRTVNETSFLSHSKSYVFGSLCHAFLLALSSEASVRQFRDLPVLRKSMATTDPLYISFFIRIWCGPYPIQARATSLKCVSSIFDKVESSADMQVLLPYLVYALGDISPKVRRAATDLILMITSRYTTIEEGEKSKEEKSVLGKHDIYGHLDIVRDVSWMSFTDVTKFLRDILVPSLEECRLDATHIIKRLASTLSGSHHRSSNTAPKELNTSTKLAIFTFLGSHINQTSIHSVRLRLLSIMNLVEKVGNVSRTKILLPLLTAQEYQSQETLRGLCANEHINESEYLSQIVGVVTPSDREGLRLLISLVLPREHSLPHQLRKAAVQRIQHIWKPIKSDMQLYFVEALLDLVGKSSTDGFEEEYRAQALEMLRSISLSPKTLLAMLGKLPTFSDGLNDETPSPKRRRIGQVRAGATHGVNDTTFVNRLKITTIILELVEVNMAGKTSQEVLKKLFQVLADIQYAKAQMQVDLGYIQSIVLNALSAIIEQERMSPSPQLDNSSVHADLVVDCVRTSSTPQVQRAALLLMSSLASALPDLVVHSVMPIFTFMGSTIFRLNDEYSTHVIDKTIESIIPPLIETLRKSKGGPVFGASELLLTFVAAFEHIPEHRRLSMFQSLIDKLGAEEFLFAILAMLTDKYAGDQKVAAFAMELSSQYNARIQLQTISKYIDLVGDALKPKRTISERLLSLGADGNADSISADLLLLPTQMLSSSRLITRTARLLSKNNSDDVEIVRRCYDHMLEQVLSIMARTKEKKKLHAAYQSFTASLLRLLPIRDFITSVDVLLKQQDCDIQRQGLDSLEQKINACKHRELGAERACINFIPRLQSLLEESFDPLLKHSAITCSNQIIEKYGKKNKKIVIAFDTVVAGQSCLGAFDTRLRIISLLCLALSVEVLGQVIIPIIPQAVPKAIDHLKTSLVEDEEDKTLHNAVYTFIGSLLIHVPWMLVGDYLDCFLRASHESANGGMGFECDRNRIDALHLIAERIEAKECLLALRKTWTNAVIEGPKAVEEHLDMLDMAIERHPKRIIAEQSHVMVDLLLEVFDLRCVQLSHRTEDSYEDEEIEVVEKTANKVAIKVIYKLNDSNFRPIFVRMLEWSVMRTSQQDRKRKLYRQITLFKFLHTFFDTLKSIVTSYAGFIIDSAIDTFSSISPKDSESVMLNNYVILTLNSCFENDQDEFWQSPTHFTSISTGLLSLVPHAASLPSLLPALTSLAASTSSSNQHKSLNSSILAYFRSEAQATRIAAIQCQISLTRRLGEDWLNLLPEMLPFIAEALEDVDEGVEIEVHTWVRLIEETLGESLDPMLL